MKESDYWGIGLLIFFASLFFVRRMINGSKSKSSNGSSQFSTSSSTSSLSAGLARFHPPITAANANSPCIFAQALNKISPNNSSSVPLFPPSSLAHLLSVHPYFIIFNSIYTIPPADLEFFKSNSLLGADITRLFAKGILKYNTTENENSIPWTIEESYKNYIHNNNNSNNNENNNNNNNNIEYSPKLLDPYHMRMDLLFDEIQYIESIIQYSMKYRNKLFGKINREIQGEINSLNNINNNNNKSIESKNTIHNNNNTNNHIILNLHELIEKENLIDIENYFNEKLNNNNNNNHSNMEKLKLLNSLFNQICIRTRLNILQKSIEIGNIDIIKLLIKIDNQNNNNNNNNTSLLPWNSLAELYDNENILQLAKRFQRIEIIELIEKYWKFNQNNSIENEKKIEEANEIINDNSNDNNNDNDNDNTDNIEPRKRKSKRAN